jgi:hypothetical protein
MQPNQLVNPVERAAGPGALEETTLDVKPLLNDATEYEYVEILNPLPVDFVAKFATTRQVRGEVRIVNNPNTPTTTETEADIRRNYGLDLRNKDHTGKVNIVSRVTIPAGQTIRVLGNEAQVIVNQLVTEIMQRQKKSLMLADPTQRNIIEQEVIKRRDSVESILGAQPRTIQEQLQSAVDLPEEEFPAITNQAKASNETTDSRGSAEGTDSAGNDSERAAIQPKRPVGRPPKTS